MNTFLSSPDFRQSMLELDPRRLGNQRLEASILLVAVTRGNGWSKHPAARMWQGYADALGLYLNTAITVWVERGGRNTMQLVDVPPDAPMPPWLGYAPFHASHRSNLLAKDGAYYARHGWAEQPGLPYVWPRNWGKRYGED